MQIHDKGLFSGRVRHEPDPIRSRNSAARPAATRSGSAPIPKSSTAPNSTRCRTPTRSATALPSRPPDEKNPARRGHGGDSAFLDWVNFTTDESDFFFGLVPISDEDVIDRVSHYCKEIFGFGITQQREAGPTSTTAPTSSATSAAWFATAGRNPRYSSCSPVKAVPPRVKDGNAVFTTS